MIHIFKLITVLTIVSLSSAGSSSQTDWSGGDGIPGPVWEWGNEFDLDSGIQSYTIPGSVSLHNALPDPIEHMVAGSIDGATSVYATDIDGDGDTDVLGVARVFRRRIWDHGPILSLQPGASPESLKTPTASSNTELS